MNDKELLELAAKAAGIKARWFRVKQWDKRRDYPGTRFFAGIKQVFGTHHAKPWNPLTDDGDALRLAVKLSITPQNYGCGCIAVSIDGDVRCDEMNADDPYAATRRAIVRAAAEIGESLP